MLNQKRHIWLLCFLSWSIVRITSKTEHCITKALMDSIMELDVEWVSKYFVKANEPLCDKIKKNPGRLSWENHEKSVVIVNWSFSHWMLCFHLGFLAVQTQMVYVAWCNRSCPWRINEVRLSQTRLIKIMILWTKCENMRLLLLEFSFRVHKEYPKESNPAWLVEIRTWPNWLECEESHDNFTSEKLVFIGFLAETHFESYAWIEKLWRFNGC